MEPTDEQLDAVRAFQTGDHLRINAFAGTGKTTTLMLLSKSTPRRGLYLAFNRSIAAEAQKKFGHTVTSSTVHSLAYRATQSEYRRGDKMTGRMNANALADALALRTWRSDFSVVKPRSQAHLVLETLKRFMHGDRETIELRDVPISGKLKSFPADELKQIVQLTVERAAQVWDRMCTPNDPVPLGHDGYLKLWALGRPRLAADYIMLDEAQDTNPVVLDVLKRQACQVVYVGDRYQQIYDWRGAVNAMEQIETPQQTHLTTSFRFGPQIAEAATAVLQHLGEELPLRGNPEIKSYLAAEGCRAILARTNAGVISTVIAKMMTGYAVHVIGGVDEIVRMLYAVSDLKQGKASDLPEFFGFGDWDEVLEFARSDEGEELRTFVSLVEAHGERRLIAALRETENSETAADIVISTAHKAKGREWPTVELLDDFLISKQTREDEDGKPKLDPAEVRLFYVALTRGQEAVQISPNMLMHFDVAPGPARPGGPAVKPSGSTRALPGDVPRPGYQRSSSPRSKRYQRVRDGHSNASIRTSRFEQKPSFLARYWWLLLLIGLVVYSNS